MGFILENKDIKIAEQFGFQRPEGPKVAPKVVTHIQTLESLETLATIEHTGAEESYHCTPEQLNKIMERAREAQAEINNFTKHAKFIKEGPPTFFKRAKSGTSFARGMAAFAVVVGIADLGQLSDAVADLRKSVYMIAKNDVTTMNGALKTIDAWKNMYAL